MKKRKERNPYSKHETWTDQLFTKSIAVSVISILLCVVSLCSATWAWFSDEVSSGGNTIKSGTYSLNMEIKPTDDASLPLTGTETEGDYYTYSLGVDKTYTVTLTAQEGSNSNGYCKITVDGIDEPYYISIVPLGEDPYTFTLKIEDAADKQTVDVTFELCWGTYSGVSAVSDDGTLTCALTSQNN